MNPLVFGTRREAREFFRILYPWLRPYSRRGPGLYPEPVRLFYLGRPVWALTMNGQFIQSDGLLR